MSSAVALQAMFDRFLGRFVLPLVEGGEVLVSYPIGPGAMEHFVVAEPSDPEVVPSIVRGRAEVLRTLVPSPAIRPVDEEELFLLAALHNVLLAGHADLSGGFRGDARWRHTLRWGLEQLARVTPCESAETALARHSLLHAVTELTRRDVVVSTRLGERRYLGQDPPKRALVWPRLRRLRTSEDLVALPDIVPEADARRALTAVLEQSPLTCLLAMPYCDADGVHAAPLRLSLATMAVLSSRDLCRAVTYRHLELGFRAVGRPLSDAIVNGIERGASAGPGTPGVERMAFGLKYVVNLQLTHCWTEADPKALVAPLEEPWGEEGESARRLFFGWAAAAIARGDRIGAPLPEDPELLEREQTYRVAAATVAGSSLDDAARQVDWLLPPRKAAAPAEG